MKHFYRTRDRPSDSDKSTIPEERREKLKSTMRKMIAVMLIAVFILITACTTLGTPIKAAEIGADVDLDDYGAYISNDELGKIVSYGGFIFKAEYASMLNDSSVGASYNPSFEACYDKSIFMSFCVESGCTFFGIVDQNYELPQEVIDAIGIEVFDYEKFEYDFFQADSFQFDTFTPDTFEYEKLGIRIPRRGVIEFGKIGYI